MQPNGFKGIGSNPHPVHCVRPSKSVYRALVQSNAGLFDCVLRDSNGHTDVLGLFQGYRFECDKVIELEYIPKKPELWDASILLTDTDGSNSSAITSKMNYFHAASCKQEIGEFLHALATESSHEFEDSLLDGQSNPSLSGARGLTREEARALVKGNKAFEPSVVLPCLYDLAPLSDTDLKSLDALCSEPDLREFGLTPIDLVSSAPHPRVANALNARISLEHLVVLLGRNRRDEAQLAIADSSVSKSNLSKICLHAFQELKTQRQSLFVASEKQVRAVLEEAYSPAWVG